MSINGDILGFMCVGTCVYMQDHNDLIYKEEITNTLSLFESKSCSQSKEELSKWDIGIQPIYL